MKKLVLLISLLSPFLTKAQTNTSPCDACKTSLQQDVYKSDMYLYQKISYLENIDELTYNKINNESSGGISFAGYGASGSYKEFKENLRRYKESISFNSLQMGNNTYSSYTTNPIIYKYFVDCVKTACAGKSFLAYMTSETETLAVLNFRYNFQGVGDRKLRVSVITTQNGKITKQIKIINPGADIPYDITRVFDNAGKSVITISIQPVDKFGHSLFDGYVFESKFFKPVLLIDSIKYEYSSIASRLLYARVI